MLYLRKLRLETVEDLRAWLLGAVRLELSTIPPYLTALYSIRPGANDDVAATIRHIVVEEMLHMCIAANILNAVGGHPTINAPEFRPTYPGPLPMGIGREPGRPFIVPLRRVSIELLQSVFMVIEEPEDPVDTSPRMVMTPDGPQDYHTIGAFYRAIEAVIILLGDSIFTGDPRLQVTGWFPPDQLFPITDVDSAVRAINIIVEQGEGTSKSPVDLEGDLAHYYLYSEIVHGRRLVVHDGRWSYTGPAIVLDMNGVYPMIDNPPLVILPEGSLVERLANQFDQSYTALLNALNATFNGEPHQLDVAIGVMYTLRLAAQQLIATPIPGMTNVHAGPRWQFVAGYASG